MKYLICKDVYDEEYEDSKTFVSTEESAEKNDLVVVIDYNQPRLLKVEGFMDELSAITSERYFLEAVKVISMKEYLENRAKEVQKAKLVKLMKEQMELQKMEDTLKKNAECNPKMADLYAKYKELSE